MRVYTAKDLEYLRSIPIYYGGELREKKRAIKVNGMIVSGVYEIRIKDDLIILKNKRHKEIARQKFAEISEIRIDTNFGEYKVI